MAKRKPVAENAAEMQHAPAVQTERERRAAMVPTFKGGGRLDVTPEQRDAMLDAMRTDHTLVLQGAINAASAANPYQDEASDRQRNLALRLLVELAPQNAVERLLVQQLVATDAAASLCLGIGCNTENNADARRRYMGLANQFLNTQVRQIEALTRLRTGGRQHVIVEHLTMESGAQAVIGNVSHAPEGGGGAGGER